MIVKAYRREQKFIKGLRDSHPFICAAYCILRYVLDLPLVILFHLVILVPMVGFAALQELGGWFGSLIEEVGQELTGMWHCAMYPFKKGRKNEEEC